MSRPKIEGRKNKDKDEDGEISDPAGPYGNIRCDSPISLADSMVHAINELVPDALFTISSGDVVDRAYIDYTVIHILGADFVYVLDSRRELAFDAKVCTLVDRRMREVAECLLYSVVEDELHSFHAQLFANLSESNVFYGSFGMCLKYCYVYHRGRLCIYALHFHGYRKSVGVSSRMGVKPY